ncbi:MAG TPA: hypothetical protein PKC29_02285 [Thermodesulfobacteriota bacterium]|nr:hypothetical protein [Thermodesulfobacteriota bacterium]
MEEYFLSLAGEGIMLSSIDYDLIRGWRDGNIPEEIVMRGISRAFGEKGPKRIPGGRIRGLRQCAEYVETCAAEYGHPAPAARVGASDESAVYESGLSAAEKLGRLIDAEKRGPARKYYAGLRARILRAEGGEGAAFKSLSELVGEAMDELFGSLTEEEREKIEAEARGRLGDRARRMTDKAYAESVASFRNEILSEKYSIKSVV